MIVVREPGFSTTVQDGGRPGYYRRGIPPSGAMDLESYAMANALVGNIPRASALEYTFMGPRLEFTEPSILAVTGGEIPVFINDEPIQQWRSYSVRAGDVLSFGFMQSGVRGYVAVSGGLDVPLLFGSRSTHVNAGFGGFRGRALLKNDVLLTMPNDGPIVSTARALDERFIPSFSKSVELRYVRGLFAYRLTESGRHDFDTREWTVTPSADRTGIRLQSDIESSLEFVSRDQPFGAGSDPSNVVDSGYPIGAIQLPSGIEPIVLSRDAVTAGGYCTVGTVCTADLDLLGQVQTHGKVRFRPISLDDALDIRQDRRRRVEEACSSVS